VTPKRGFAPSSLTRATEGKIGRTRDAADEVTASPSNVTLPSDVSTSRLTVPPAKVKVAPKPHTSLYLDPDLLAWFKEWCRVHDQSMNTVLSAWIEQFRRQEGGG